MHLPKITSQNVATSFTHAELVVETANQIMKDFGMFGVEINFSGMIDTAYQELHEQLVAEIDRINQSNAELLLSILYQVDLSDRAIDRAKLELPNYTHTEVIAHEVIVRDLKKVMLRRYFKEQTDQQAREIEE